VPIDGQPKSIVRELEDMARSYIKVLHAQAASLQMLTLPWTSQSSWHATESVWLQV
jgi:hypothetical protein